MRRRVSRSHWRGPRRPTKTTAASRASLTSATALASLGTSHPTTRGVACGLADRLVKVHDRRAVRMRLWPEPGEPAVAPQVSLPSWKS